MDIFTPTPKDSTDVFDDIRPFRDDEVPSALKRIASDEKFSPMMRYIYPGENFANKVKEFTTYTKVSEFQIKFMFDAINRVIDNTMTNFTFNGFDYLQKGKGYLFISNHRDILLDAALLQMALYHNGLDCSEITFGDNLMQPGFITDIGRTNRMFKVVRSGTSSEFYRTSLHLSEYIRYCITKRNTSIWIANRKGRAKNGDDSTSQTILKMFSLSGGKNIIENLSELNIVPIAISYQFETCIKQKVRELYLSKNKTYIKEQGEDLRSILNGIVAKKGDVHIQVCKPIDFKDYNQLEGLDRNEALNQLAMIINNRIYTNYKMHKTNYIAHDMLYNKFEYTDKYSQEDYREFAQVMHETLSDWKEELLELMEIYLKIYSTPIDNFISVK